jgi:hypothetical protein
MDSKRQCKFFKNGKCKKGDNCDFEHNSSLSTKQDNRRQKIKRNTESWQPLNKEVDLRIVFQSAITNDKLNKALTNRDILLVPDLYSDYNKLQLYNLLNEELEECKQINLGHGDGVELVKLWHGNETNPGTHSIVDDKVYFSHNGHKSHWKDNCKTFNMILDRAKDFFNVDIKATRFNIYENSNNWKPFHHDSAAVDPRKAKTQNITIAISFGLKRTIGLESADSIKSNRKIISFEIDDGEIYCFTKKTNELWRHGVLQEKEFSDKGRISIIIWGYVPGLD